MISARGRMNLRPAAVVVLGIKYIIQSLIKSPLETFEFGRIVYYCQIADLRIGRGIIQQRILFILVVADLLLLLGGQFAGHIDV